MAGVLWPRPAGEERGLIWFLENSKKLEFSVNSHVVQMQHSNVTIHLPVGANPLKIQWDSFNTRHPLLRVLPPTPTNVHFFLQNLGTKLPLDTLLCLSAGWQNNMYRVIIPVMLKNINIYQWLENNMPRLLYSRLTVITYCLQRVELRDDFVFNFMLFWIFPNE